MDIIPIAETQRALLMRHTLIIPIQVSVLFNTFLAQRLHLVEGLALVLHVCDFFGIMIPLWVLSPTADSTVVWTTFNDNGWSSTGLACMIEQWPALHPCLEQMLRHTCQKNCRMRRTRFQES